MAFNIDIATTISAKITFDQINVLISHIIWPIAVIVALILFRKHLANVINRLGSVEAGATGVSISFDNQIKETEQLLLSKSGATPKSGVQLKSSNKTIRQNSSPYQELLNIREALHNQIIAKAQQFNIATQNKSSIELCDALLELNEITPQNAQFFMALIDLTSSGGTDINQQQLNKVKQLHENMQL
jgi:hypothetical protein